MSGQFSFFSGEQALRRSAAPRIAKAVARGDAAAFQSAMTRELAKPAKRIRKRFAETPLMTLWSADHDDEAAVSTMLLALADPQASRKKKDILSEVRAAASTLAAEWRDESAAVSPLAVATAAEILLRYGADLEPELFCTLFDALLQMDLSELRPLDMPQEHLNVEQVNDSVVLAAAEIPFCLGLLLNGIQVARDYTAIGSRTLEKIIDAATDTDGSLHAALVERVDRWMAPIVRMAAWADAFETRWATKKTRRRWDQVIQHVAGFVTPDGFITQAVRGSHSSEPDVAIELLRHAARLAEFEPESDLGRLLKSAGSKSKSRRKGSRQAQQHVFCEQSDWAESALLRSGTRLDADVMALLWHQNDPQLFLAALGTPFLGGSWHSEVRVNGQVAAEAGDWTCTCWFQDKEVAFAELERGSADGVRHVRHVMLSLDDHFAVLTESATSPDAEADVELQSTLPLVPGVASEDHPVTREMLLQTDCHTVRVIPAWLDDDRVRSALGELVRKEDALLMTARQKGGVTTPLVLDWHPDRITADADWNTLTVTEDRQKQTSHTAAGFRVRIGRLQLMLYRSLRAGETLRAVLGLHTPHETVYGRVTRSGTIAPLILVESEA